ncbi:cytochrome c-type biogenesis protein CcmH [Chengkuizengella sediminis]|uniref:cytochrome c-type biogenesis protein CcmH n=1 Tax=Chengkuizengella sediminis TaxID=1885917 RepID=UPI0013894E4A|nr:cytochrome c-type biogenesis protein CcmH [Chengkuizengella sediminis]NDI33826.1 cytochrome c-type biogenesis protein CcmH [Chengkuizengella sediminis]
MKKFVFLLIFLLLLSVNVIFAEEDFDYSSKEFQSIVSMLSMEGHSGDDLATCPVKQTYYNEVAELMAQGKTKDEILNDYVDQLGEEALAAPIKTGFSLTAWITPFFLLFVATFLVYFLIKKWVRPNQTSDLNREFIDETENEILLSVIEKERKKYF